MPLMNIKIGGRIMIIWMGWYFVSIMLMAMLGLKRYSLSNMLLRTLVEVQNDEAKAYEVVFVMIEMMLVFSDNSIWNNSFMAILVGIAILLISQWLLMRLAFVASSGFLRIVLERRIASLKKSYLNRIRRDFQ